jgi:hypothetical protein
LLTVVSKAVSLIGDAISFIGDPFASRELSFAVGENLLPPLQRSCAPIESTSIVSLVNGHDSA